MEVQQAEIPNATLQPQLELPAGGEVPNYAQIAAEAGQAADAARAEREALYAQSSFVPSAETRNAETVQTETALADAKKAREDAIYQKALGKSEDEIYDNAYTDAYLKSIKGTMDEGYYTQSAGETQARHDVREPAAAEEARQHAEDELRMARRNAETEVEADRLWQSTYANKLQELGATEIADTNDPNDLFNNAALNAADEAVAAYRQKRRPLVDKLSNAAEQFSVGSYVGRIQAAADRERAAAEEEQQPPVVKQAGANPGDDPKAKSPKPAGGNVYKSIFAGDHRSDFQLELAEEASHEQISAVEAIAADMLHSAQETEDGPIGDKLWRDYSNFLQRNKLSGRRIENIVSDALFTTGFVANPDGRSAPGDELDDDEYEDDNSARRGLRLSKQDFARGWQNLRDSKAWSEAKRAGGDIAWGWDKLRNSKLFRRFIGNRALAGDQQADQNA